MPIFVNVNTATATAPKAWQWDLDLIGYDAFMAYGSPSYYVQKIFANCLGDKIIPMTGENIATQNPPLSRRGSMSNTKPAPVPAIFYSATQDSKTGVVYLKVVNVPGKAQSAGMPCTHSVSKMRLCGLALIQQSILPVTYAQPWRMLPIARSRNTNNFR